MSVFYELGGLKTVTTALDRFYPKVLGDPRMGAFFNEISTDGLRKQVGPFMALVLCGLNEAYSSGLRKTCERLARLGLKGRVFDAFLNHFEEALEDAGVPAEKIARAMQEFDEARCELCVA